MRNRLIAIAWLTCWPLLAAGGEGDLAWAKRAGGLDAEHGKAIARLSDGTLVVAGDFRGVSTFGPGETGETQLTSAGSADVLVARYTAGGSLIWAKRAGGVSNDYATAIGVLADGTVVAAGYFSGTATFGKGEGDETILTSAGSYDLFVAKYNSDGTLAWAKRAGGEYADEAHGVTVFPDGSLAITGSFQGTAVFGKDEPGEASLVSAGLRDVFVAKYNSDGTLASAWRAGGANWDYGVAIAGFADGSTAITGDFQGTATFGKDEPGETVLTSAGIPDVFVARFNPDGTLAWAKRAGGDRHDYGRGIVALSDGTLVVSGSFLKTATFGPGEADELTSLGFSDIFLARYNVDGTLAWAKRAGGSDWDYAEGLALLSGDVVAVTGYFKGTATFGLGDPAQTSLVSAGDYDAFVARYNPDGTLAGAGRSGGTGEDRGYGLAVGQYDGLLSTGWFEGTATFGPGAELTSDGGTDIFLTGAYGGAGTLLYVDADATGGNNGLSWADAFTDLQSALSFAESGYEIWVAKGSYLTTSGGERTASLVLMNGVGIYGGFVGTETARSQRDPLANTTTLSGDIGTPGDSSDNSYHVLVGATGATLDGFTVTGGAGSAVGGGMYNNGASPTVANCVFSGNTAASYGGGMYNKSSSPQLTNCLFVNNTATNYYGGAVYNNASSPSLTNCTLSGNTASKGGAMANMSGSSPAIKNCIFWGNSAGTGNEFYNSSSTPVVSYSCVAGGYAGTGNVGSDPLFAGGGDYHLKSPIGRWTAGGWVLDGASSPGIDAGDPASAYADEPTPDGSQVNMGFYGNTAQASKGGQVVYYVDADATGAGVGTSWTDAFTDLQNALALARSSNEIWVAEGTYLVTSGTDRDASFRLKSGVGIYGGFVGTETARSQRDPLANTTTLSGDIGTPGDSSDNSYHVLVGATGATLDGFTVTGGAGSAVGGGMYNNGASPTVANCVFSGNTAASYGGGMYNKSSSPQLTNCLFVNNTVTSYYGGAVYNNASSPSLTNCTLSGNTASKGGAMANMSGSSPAIKNCIFWGNSAGTGNEFYNSSSTPAVSYSCVAGGYAGTGNISSDPLFAGGGDYHLKSTEGRWTAGGWVLDGVSSLGIDAGDPASAYAEEPAPNGSQANMGVYGNTAQASKSGAGAEAGADDESEDMADPDPPATDPPVEVF